jgi:fucose 4-O-acetylase-like acetyltransferase
VSISQYDFSRRQEWIDAFRGFAILLVIASHIARYFSDHLSGYAIHSYFSVFVDAIAPLRMEALFFLSGMLVYRSARKGRKAYIQGKVNAILWPYIVWTTVMLVLGYNNLSNNLLPALYGFSQSTWFLAFLFSFYLISDATKHIDFRIVLGVTYCVAVILFVTGSPIDRNFVNLWDFAYYYLFFRCGDQLVRSEAAVSLSQARPTIVIGAVSIVAVMIVGATLLPPKTHPAYFPFVLAAFPFLFRVFSTIRTGKFLPYVGRNSIYFFVIHYPVMVISKKVIEVTTGSVSLLAIVCIALLTLAIPAITQLFAERNLLVRSLFVLPSLSTVNIPALQFKR